jgi:hypothetical protein
MHGRWQAALQANLGGAILCLLDIVALPWLLISAVRGRWFLWEPCGSAVAWTMAVVSLVAFLDWGRRIWLT